MRRTRRMSEERIRSLPYAPKGTRYDVPEGAVTGLFIRVGAKSKKFVMVARFGGAKNPTRRTIGSSPLISLEKAREIASKWNLLVERGFDPGKEERRIKTEESQRRRSTFRSVMEDYLATLPFRERNRHAQDDIKLIRREVLNSDRNPWINKPISDVTDVDIAELIADIRNRPAPAEAYITFGHIRTFFFWAMSPERRTSFGLNANPIVSVKPKQLGLSTQERTHVLNVNELRAYWKTAEAIEYPLGPFYRGSY